MSGLDLESVSHWEEKFRSRGWGRYPNEDLVRFVGRTYREAAPREISVLEIGCGPGPNLWFLHREGFRVAGIDGAPSAIKLTALRLAQENKGLNPAAPDLRVGDFSSLPWKDETFELVVDIFALYANPLVTIKRTLQEVRRVLKPNGRFFSKLWGRRTTGCGSGIELEPFTCDKIDSGPCHNMGISHFCDLEEIHQLFSEFNNLTIDTILRTDSVRGYEFEEFIVHCRK